jgi:translocation and assembly module TamB
VRADNLTYVNEQYGTRITNLALRGRFDASRLEISQLSGRAGRGTVTGSGSIGLASAGDFPIDMRLQFDNAQLAHSDDLAGTATGNLAITNGAEGALISGDLELGEARYQFVRQAATEVRELAGVRRRGQPIAPPDRKVPIPAFPASGGSTCGCAPTIACSSPAWASIPNGRPTCTFRVPLRRRPSSAISS